RWLCIVGSGRSSCVRRGRGQSMHGTAVGGRGAFNGVRVMALTATLALAVAGCGADSMRASGGSGGSGGDGGGRGGRGASGTGGVGGMGGAGGSGGIGGTGVAGASGGGGGTQQADCFASPGSCGYPDPAFHNVGVPPGTTLTNSGSMTVSTDGAVIDGMNITGSVSIVANNVTIQNSRIACSTCAGSFAVFEESTVSGLKIINSEISGGNVGYFGGDGAIGKSMSGVYMWNCDECAQYVHRVTDSYFYIGQAVSGAHYEALYGG